MDLMVSLVTILVSLPKLGSVPALSVDTKDPLLFAGKCRKVEETSAL